jgi:hypothetical protein
MDARISCGAIEGAKERPVLLRAVACDACWDDAVHFPDREPGQIDVELTVEPLRPGPAADPRDEGGTTCHELRRCMSLASHRARSLLLLEPDGCRRRLKG